MQAEATPATTKSAIGRGACLTGTASVNQLLPSGLDPAYPTVGEPHRHEAYDAESRVDDPPPKGNPSDVAEDQRPHRNERASDHPKPIQPPITNGITNGANESETYHEVARGQPIRSVEHEWRPVGGGLHGVADDSNPRG